MFNDAGSPTLGFIEVSNCLIPPGTFIYFVLIHVSTHHECVPLTAMDGSSVNAQNVQNSETAHNYIVKKAFLKMSVMLPHMLEGVTFLHSTAKHKFLLSHCTVSGCLLRQQRRKRHEEIYTEGGKKGCIWDKPEHICNCCFVNQKYSSFYSVKQETEGKENQ